MPRDDVVYTFYANCALTETESGVSGAGEVYLFLATCELTETESGWVPITYLFETTCSLTETESGAKMSGYMTVWYYSKPATMTDDSFVCGLPLEVQGIMVKMAEVTARRRRGEDVRALEASIEADIRSLSEAGVPGRGRGSRLAPGIEPGVEGAD